MVVGRELPKEHRGRVGDFDKKGCEGKVMPEIMLIIGRAEVKPPSQKTLASPSPNDMNQRRHLERGEITR